MFRPGQTGPHIYDQNGELVWSGAHLFDDRPTFDFRVASWNDSQYLTFIAGEDLREYDFPGGSGVVLDNSYRFVQNVDERTGRGVMNMHEFNIIDDGRRALMITFGSKFVDVDLGDDAPRKMFVGNNGFSEVDTSTGLPVFSWWALDHIHPSESTVDHPSEPGHVGSAWDFFHMNSVDKIAGGDYLISARFTNTIYKISGKDGSIIWRLGGRHSDFKLDGFNFSSQHDARWRSGNDTTTVLTFLNNHSDGILRTANTTSAMKVLLDMTTMTASLINEWKRPDDQLTKLRGNAQRLENNHMFVGWSENTYISEYNAEGSLIMEAQMASHRFNTYRAYKMNFTAYPSEPIVAKAFVYGASPQTATTVCYVSWNGATEVAEWKFWGSIKAMPVNLGTSSRTGFETVFMASGIATNVQAEAIDVHGNSLGKSEVIVSELPSGWNPDDILETLTVGASHETSASLSSQDINPEEVAADTHAGESESILSVWYFREIFQRNPDLPAIASCMMACLLLTTIISVALWRRRLQSRGQNPAWAKYEVLISRG